MDIKSFDSEWATHPSGTVELEDNAKMEDFPRCASAPKISVQQ